MTLKKFFTALVLCFAFISTHSQAAPINTDVVFVVDESGSMDDVQANLRDNIGLFASTLQDTGEINAQFGLVGYGSSSVDPRRLTDLTNPSAFSTAADNLLDNGGTEPGYTATAFALNALDNQSDQFSYRSNAVKNIIILTDEPSNGDSTSAGAVGGNAVSESILDGILTTNDALYNGVLRDTDTINSYETLITDHGGQVFDLNDFDTTNQTDVENFVDQFANAKLQETLTFCEQNPDAPECVSTVPVPSGLALLTLGLAGLVVGRRKWWKMA